MRKWLLQLTQWILQGLLCAAVILRMGNSHISSSELLIKPRLKNSASSEENIYEIYFILLKSQTHPLRSWKKLVQIQASCSKIQQYIFEPHVLGEKHWCNTLFQWLWIHFLTHPLLWRKKENMSTSTVLNIFFFVDDWCFLNEPQAWTRI